MCQRGRASRPADAREVESTRAARLRGHFRRPEAWDHARDYLRGLLAEVERKNGWQLGRAGRLRPPAGDPARARPLPVGRRGRARQTCGAYRRGAPGATRGRCWWSTRPRFPKQGAHSAGVARQYCGTLGKRANCQVGVFLGCAAPKGHAGLDRALYLPQEWTDDRSRCLPRAFPTRCPSAPSPSWPWPWWSGRWTRGCRRPGSSPTRCTATTASSAAPWRRATKPTSSPCAATTPSGPGRRSARRPGRSRRWWPRHWRRGPRPGPAGARGEGAQGPRVYDWAYFPVRSAVRDEEGWVHAVLVPPPPAPGRGRLLSGLRPHRHRPRGGRPRGRRAVDDRGHLQAGQGAGGARPLRGPQLAGLAPPRNPGPAGPRHPDRRHPTGGAAWTAPCPVHIPITVPEVRRLLVASCGPPSAPRPPSPRSLPGPAGAAGTNASPRSATSVAVRQQREL